MDLQQQFQQAAIDVKQLAEKPSNDILLQLYSLYKQGTEGDNNEDAPTNPFDFPAKFKYEAWKKLQGTSKENAMQQYIDLVKKLITK